MVWVVKANDSYFCSVECCNSGAWFTWSGDRRDAMRFRIVTAAKWVAAISNAYYEEDSAYVVRLVSKKKAKK